MDMSTVIMYNQDCADLCRLTAQLLERKSENADIFFKNSFSDVRRCASECEKYPQMVLQNVGKPVVNVQKCAMNMKWQ
jgi:hypothetical protein